MIGRCEKASPSCKYYEREPLEFGNQENGCFSDRDHVYGRGKGQGALAKKFCFLMENMVQLCRQEHDDKDPPYLPLPSVQTMKLAIEQQKINRRLNNDRR